MTGEFWERFSPIQIKRSYLFARGYDRSQLQGSARGTLFFYKTELYILSCNSCEAASLSAELLGHGQNASNQC